MKIGQLEAFREVMLTGTMSGAGRNLRRSQPAISALISALENEVGLKLFVRDGGRLQPVPEAHYLLEEAQEILGRLESAAAMMKSIRDTDRGTIRVASMPGPSVFLVPAIIADFVKDRGDVDVSLTSRSSTVVQQLIASQQYDIGFADTDVETAQSSSLVEHEAYSFRCLCAIHRDDPLARQSEVSVSDLDGRPMAALYRGHPTRRQTENAFAEAGASFTLRFEAQYFIPLLTYVERRLANAIVDPITAAGYAEYAASGGSIVFRALDADVRLDTSLMTPRHHRRTQLSYGFATMMRTRLAAIRDRTF